MVEIKTRLQFARQLCENAGKQARDAFGNRAALLVDQKGAQDWVSEADRDVELLIRKGLDEAFPTDGVFGEEHATKSGTSGFDWVIDPIDGTTNFVNGIPAWVVVLAGIAEGQTQIGVIHDPMAGETFVAVRDGGASLNDQPIAVAREIGFDSGTVAVGYSNRVEAANVVPVIAALVDRGAMFHRNASGALSLAYVAAGRMLGYVEEHMNAWDCLAGQLLISEAGGRIEEQDANSMLRDGGRVIASAPQVFDELRDIADGAWSTG